MTTDSEVKSDESKPTARTRNGKVGLTFLIEEPAMAAFLEAIRATVESAIETKLTPLANQLDKVMPNASERPPPPRGVELTEVLKRQASDLRMAVLLGKVPEETGLLIDTKVAAKLLNISPRTLYRLVDLKAMPAPVRIGGNMIRWRLAELLAWIEADCPPQRDWTYRTDSETPKKKR